MLRKKYTLCGLVILSLLIMVLSGCGGSKSGNGGGNEDPVFIDFDAEAFENTTWRCNASGDRPQITVYIDELFEDHGSIGCYFTGSVVSTTTGSVSITEEDILGHNLGNYIQLIGSELAGNLIIAFNVGAANAADDYIQIDGLITQNDPKTVTVAYLLVDYEDEQDHSDYEYDIEDNSEVVQFKKLIKM